MPLIDDDILSELTITNNTIDGISIQLASSEITKITIDKNTMSGNIGLELVAGYESGELNVIKSVHITNNTPPKIFIMYEYAEVDETVIANNSGEIEVSTHEASWNSFLIDGEEYEGEDEDDEDEDDD